MKKKLLNIEDTLDDIRRDTCGIKEEQKACGIFIIIFGIVFVIVSCIIIGQNATIIMNGNDESDYLTGVVEDFRGEQSIILDGRLINMCDKSDANKLSIGDTIKLKRSSMWDCGMDRHRLEELISTQ